VSANRIIEFSPEHLLDFEDIEGRLDDNAEREGIAHKQLGPCASFTVDGKVVMCGGIHVFWRGMGEAWMSLRKGCIGPSVLFVAREWLNTCIGLNHLDRVQAITHVGGKWARTMEFLGFSFEAEFRKFGPNGVDKVMWARVQ